MSNEREHARYSPSSLKSRRICPRWENKPESGPAAEEGTRLHAACDTGETEGLDDEQKTAVSMVRSVYAEIEAALGPEAKCHTEERVEITGMEPPLFGYLDRYWTLRDQAVIADAKFGRVQVDDAETNVQGWAYAVALWDTHPEIETIGVVFAQPRTDTISRHAFERKADYARLRLEVERIVDRCKDGSLPPSKDVDNCLYCGNKARCPAINEAALAVAVNYGELAIPDQIHPSEITDPKQMELALRIAPVLEDWAKSVKRSSVEMWLSGTHIPGMALIERDGKPKITSAVAAWLAAKDAGLSEEEFLEACEVSWGGLKDAVGAKAPRGKKGAAQQDLENTLSDKGILERGAPIRYLKRNKE